MFNHYEAKISFSSSNALGISSASTLEIPKDVDEFYFSEGGNSATLSHGGELRFYKCRPLGLEIKCFSSMLEAQKLIEPPETIKLRASFGY